MNANPFSLLFDHEPLLPARHSSLVPQAAASLEVLVVDDDPASRDVLGAVIAALGHRCRVAADEHAALRAIGRTQPKPHASSRWAR